MAIQQKTYTNEEFWEVTQRPENANKRLELIDGLIVEKGESDDMASSNRLNTVVAARVVYHLNDFVLPHDLGYVVGADSGFNLGPGQVRQPDAAFIHKSRVDRLEGATFDGAPDLAVEVISPNEKPRAVVDKARLYLENGAKLVWAIYPEDRVVDVYRLGEGDTLLLDTLMADETLSGEDVLPGFSLAVSAIFPPD